MYTFKKIHSHLASLIDYDMFDDSYSGVDNIYNALLQQSPEFCAFPIVERIIQSTFVAVLIDCENQELHYSIEHEDTDTSMVKQAYLARIYKSKGAATILDELGSIVDIIKLPSTMRSNISKLNVKDIANLLVEKRIINKQDNLSLSIES